MKEIRKTVFALIAAMMLMFAMPSLPSFADEGNASGYTEETGDTVPEPIAAQDTQPAIQDTAPVNAPSDTESRQRSGVSFGTVFLLFVLSILINAGISFIVANRFYGMSKKDTKIQSEIRALRRDIAEKFTGSVTEIKEKSASVTNTNKNYARNGSITYKEEEAPEEFSEISKRWNINVETAADPEVKIRTGRRKATERRENPRSGDTRRIPRGSGDEKIDADADVSESVKNKAKKFLGDIFPFEDE